jgi:hypothetical protein
VKRKSAHESSDVTVRISKAAFEKASEGKKEEASLEERRRAIASVFSDDSEDEAAKMKSANRKLDPVSNKRVSQAQAKNAPVPIASSKRNVPARSARKRVPEHVDDEDEAEFVLENEDDIEDDEEMADVVEDADDVLSLDDEEDDDFLAVQKSAKKSGSKNVSKRSSGTKPVKPSPPKKAKAQPVSATKRRVRREDAEVEREDDEAYMDESPLDDTKDDIEEEGSLSGSLDDEFSLEERAAQSKRRKFVPTAEQIAENEAFVMNAKSSRKVQMAVLEKVRQQDTRTAAAIEAEEAEEEARKLEARRKRRMLEEQKEELQRAQTIERLLQRSAKSQQRGRKKETDLAEAMSLAAASAEDRVLAANAALADRKSAVSAAGPLPPNTVRYVNGPSGVVLIVPDALFVSQKIQS